MRRAEEFEEAREKWITETTESCVNNVLNDVEEAIEEAYTTYKTFRKEGHVYVEKFFNTMKGIMELKNEDPAYSDIYSRVCATVEESVKEYGWECKYQNNGKTLYLVPISEKK